MPSEQQPISNEAITFSGKSYPIKRGSWIIFTDLCKGCGLCIEKCPSNVIEKKPELGCYGAAVVGLKGNQCSGCKICELHCPDSAISIRHS